MDGRDGVDGILVERACEQPWTSQEQLKRVILENFVDNRPDIEWAITIS